MPKNSDQLGATARRGQGSASQVVRALRQAQFVRCDSSANSWRIERRDFARAAYCILGTGASSSPMGPQIYCCIVAKERVCMPFRKTQRRWSGRSRSPLACPCSGATPAGLVTARFCIAQVTVAEFEWASRRRSSKHNCYQSLFRFFPSFQFVQQGH